MKGHVFLVFLGLSIIQHASAKTCKDGVNYPAGDPRDCNKYFDCNNGQVEHVSCPEGLDFNSVYKICDFPESSGCILVIDPLESTSASPGAVQVVTEEATTPQSTETSTDPLCNTVLPAEGTTIDNVELYQTTTELTLITSEDERQQFSTESDCKPGVHDLRGDSVCSSGATYSFPNPRDCKQFFQCFNGDKYTLSCPNGLHYNQKMQKCDWPQNAPCGTFLRNIRNDWNPPIINDPDCPKEGVFYLTHPEDCTKYYQCLDGNKFTFTCPSGLHFNAVLEVCDWPASAGCYRKKTTPIPRQLNWKASSRTT